MHLTSLLLSSNHHKLCLLIVYHKFVFNHPLWNVPQTCLHSWDSSILGSSVDRFERKIQLSVICILQCIEGKWWLIIEKIHSCKWRTKAGLNRSLEERHTWSIVSKGALRSRNTSKVTCCSFIFINISAHSCSRAVSVRWNFPYAYWTQKTVEKKTCGGIIADPLLFRSLWRGMWDFLTVR